jgi:hypothetical protein
LTVSQVLDDTRALSMITNGSFQLDVADTGANIAAALSALSQVSQISSISITDGGSSSVFLDSQTASQDAGIISKITNASGVISIRYSVADYLANQASLDSRREGIVIYDSAANVSAYFNVLNEDTHVSQIILSDAQPTLTLTAMQAIGDTSTLEKITNSSYAVAVL